MVGVGLGFCYFDPVVFVDGARGDACPYQFWIQRGGGEEQAEDAGVVNCVCWARIRGGKGYVVFAEEEVKWLVQELALREAVCNSFAFTAYPGNAIPTDGALGCCVGQTRTMDRRQVGDFELVKGVEQQQDS